MSLAAVSGPECLSLHRAGIQLLILLWVLGLIALFMIFFFFFISSVFVFPEWLAQY